MIELKNNNYFWQYQHTCQLIPTLLDVIIVRYSYIFELNHSMGIFFWIVPVLHSVSNMND